VRCLTTSHLPLFPCILFCLVVHVPLRSRLMLFWLLCDIHLLSLVHPSRLHLRLCTGILPADHDILTSHISCFDSFFQSKWSRTKSDLHVWLMFHLWSITSAVPTRRYSKLTWFYLPVYFLDRDLAALALVTEFQIRCTAISPPLYSSLYRRLWN